MLHVNCRRILTAEGCWLQNGTFFFLGKLARLGLESLVVSSDAVSGLDGSFFFFFFFFFFFCKGGPPGALIFGFPPLSHYLFCRLFFFFFFFFFFFGLELAAAESSPSRN